MDKKDENGELSLAQKRINLENLLKGTKSSLKPIRPAPSPPEQTTTEIKPSKSYDVFENRSKKTISSLSTSKSAIKQTTKNNQSQRTLTNAKSTKISLHTEQNNQQQQFLPAEKSLQQSLQQPRGTNLANWKSTRTIVRVRDTSDHVSWSYYLFLGIFLLVLIFLIITLILAKTRK